MPDKNAAAQRVMANALLLRDMGFDVIFIGPTKDRTSAVAEVNGFKCEYVDYPTSTSSWLKYITIFVSTDKILEHKPDYVVLYNFPSVASLKILKTCHKHGIEVVHDLTEWESNNHWSPADIMRKIDINLRMRYCMKKMDGVIAISRYLYEYYKGCVNTIMMPPTVDLKAEKWNRNRKLTSGHKIKLVYAGNAGFGIKDRLDIIVKAVVKYPNMQLDVIGMNENNYINGYGPLPKECNNIIFHGRISHAEAIKAVQNADFQFLIRDNNRKNNAGFPTKFVESMACCTPIIATLTSNIGDYLIDGQNGYVVDDCHSLADVLDSISRLSSSEIVKMKEACRDMTVFDYHEYKNIIEKIFR